MRFITGELWRISELYETFGRKNPENIPLLDIRIKVLEYLRELLLNDMGNNGE